MTTIADIQAKFVKALEAKLPSRSSMNPRSINKALSEFDGDNDGFLTLNEFKRSVERCGNALSTPEAEFLYAFWDTCAGQNEPRNKMEIKMAVNDLMCSEPTYQGAFNSGDDSNTRYSQNKSNAPSQTGGIFGGGSYEADARGDNSMPNNRGGTFVSEPYGQQMEVRPRGNQPSIKGGIFNPDPEVALPPSSCGGNKSNRSSVQGGIFAEMDNNREQQPLSRRHNSNASSIPGGIFG